MIYTDGGPGTAGYVEADGAGTRNALRGLDEATLALLPHGWVDTNELRHARDDPQRNRTLALTVRSTSGRALQPWVSPILRVVEHH